MTLRLVCVLVALVGVSQPVPKERPRFRLPPVDEADNVPAFNAYRDRLRAAVVARNPVRVLALTHPEVGGGLGGVLRAGARPNAPGETWTALQEILSLGGTFTRGPNRVRGAGQRQHAAREFCAPYTWSAYPQPIPSEVEAQAQSYPWVILRSDAPVLARPPRNMDVLMRLNYDLVHPYSPADPHGGAPEDWVAILTPDARRGYIDASSIRDPFDYHACFGEFTGKWLMTMFRRGGGA